jgi:hypothetical protein
VSRKKTLAVGSAGVGLGVSILLLAHTVAKKPTAIRGAIVTRAADPTKELPIADVEVSVIGGPPARVVHSDASGYFGILLPWRKRIPGAEPATLRFRHPGYQPLDLSNIVGDQLYIAHLTPLEGEAPLHGSEVTIAHVVAQYSIGTTTSVNVGSAVKTFKVVNTGNVPCEGRRPCSPDGKWKAALGSVSIDAGPGNEFRNARASCIAGPCPFTRIESNNFNSSADSHTLRVSALNWSDTATFLLEAEVYKHLVRDVLRQSYPVVFDRALTFTLPAAAEGVSIEAELNRSMVVFPLGPSLLLSWANCQLLVNKDQTKVYRCELKPGYRFSQDAGAAEISLESRP